MADWTPYAIGAIAGAITGWGLKQWQSLALIRKITDERDDLRRQFQESLDERETDWNEVNSTCSQDLDVLTASTWSFDSEALAVARDRVCRSIAARIIPKYL
jgi:hypothetical protein